MYMPLCRECYNEKCKQKITTNIIFSETQSTALNESNEDINTPLLDMESLRKNNNTSSLKFTSN